jgi:bacterioferritin-associated ferredoxin
MTFREKQTDCRHGHKHRHGHHERSTRGGRHSFHGLHELLHGLLHGHRAHGGSALSEDRRVHPSKHHQKESLEEAQSPEGDIVCSCRKITDEHVLRIIREKGLKTVDEVVHSTGAGCDCGRCITDIERLLIRGNDREPVSRGNL